MKANRFWPWLVFSLGAAYFIVPLIATFEFSLKMRRGYYSFDSYASVFSDPRFQATFGYSVVIGILAIIVGILVVVPAVYFVRLRTPWLKPLVEFFTLMPLIILLHHPLHRFGHWHRHSAHLCLCHAGPALYVSRRRYRHAHHRHQNAH
jgi:ABC-type spermidine/putrescine transport system permease subunit I